MPLPWVNQDVSEEERVDADAPIEYSGNVVPPRYDNVLKAEEIDQEAYYHETKHRQKNRDVVASVKVNSDDIDQFCEENVTVLSNTGDLVPDDYDISRELRNVISDERLLQNLSAVKVERLNAVQRKSMKVINDGYGLLVEAPTGIGKTYAFLIPAIEKALSEKRKRTAESTKPSPCVLIIANTGALVKQLHDRCGLLLGLQCMNCVEPIHDIKIDMLVASHIFTTDSCDIAFATMGKLKATIESGGVVLDYLKTIILDEADKMIDPMAFGQDIEWILKQMKEEVRENLQACFFSATYDRDMEGSIALTRLQELMLRDKPWRLVHCPGMPGYITQTVILLPRPNFRSLSTHPWIIKMKLIRDLIDKDLRETKCQKEGPYQETIIIFCETVGRVSQVTMALRLLGYNFLPMSRLISNQMKEVTVNDLEFKRIHGIVCTNIMARGIDVSSIKHTIIMEMSNEFNSYKHRIGRVGRDGNGGKATVLIDENMLNGQGSAVLDQLCIFMDQCQQQKPDWMNTWFRERYLQNT